MPAPKANRNAEKHGFYKKIEPGTTLEQQIDMMLQMQTRLKELIEAELEKDEEGSASEILKFFALLSQSSSRVARLIRAYHEVADNRDDWLEDALREIENVKLAIING